MHSRKNFGDKDYIALKALSIAYSPLFLEIGRQPRNAVFLCHGIADFIYF